MSVTSAPRHETSSSAHRADYQRGLTLRSFFICIFAMLFMGIWIQYGEVVTGRSTYASGGPFAENAPPNSAVSVILVLLAVSALLYLLRRSLRLRVAELVIIYTALLIAAPLMTQGMWHRFFGIISTIPHDGTWYYSYYDALPPMLWPHGENHVVNGRFVQKLDGFTFTPVEGTGKLSWEDQQWRGKSWSCPVIDHGEDVSAVSTLSFSVPRLKKNGAENLTPGDPYIYTMLLKAEGFSGSHWQVAMQADDSLPEELLIGNTDTAPTFLLQNGFNRAGKSQVTVPRALDKTLTFNITLHGPGKITVHDIEFMNVRAIEGAYTGVNIVSEGNLDTLGTHERYLLVVKPDNMWSMAGVKYLLNGFIPWNQWVVPLFAWTALVGALFLGLFGFNVIMRKQWVENERFTFPMNIFPRHLFAEEEDGRGRRYLAIFRNRVFWLGFAITLPLVLLKGFHFYNPAIPAPMWGDQWGNPTLSNYVTNPLLKAMLFEVRLSLVFSLLAIMLLVEKDILFSIWASYLLFQFTRLFGQMFNLNRFGSDYPFPKQQAIGAFLGYALIAVIAARRHLTMVFKHIIGKSRMDDSQEVVSYRWALACIVLSMLLLLGWGVWTGVGVAASLLFFGFLLVVGFVASKIRAECGPAYGYWFPSVGIFLLSAAGGFAVFGGTGMLVASIASGFMLTSCFFFIAPVQVEMMELGRHFKIWPKDIAKGLGIGLLGGVIIGMMVMMVWSYGVGANNIRYNWPYMPAGSYYYFIQNMGATDAAFRDGTLGTKPDMRAFDLVHNINAKTIAVGAAVTGVLALLRSMFVWFPLHPLGYLIALTDFGLLMWFTCFVAWLARVIVLRIGGAHTVRNGLVPFAIGMFLACIVSIIFFDALGLYLRSSGVADIYSTWP